VGQGLYESYEQPDYIWQSSSASNDFEPKFSLVPVAFGTFKAAFYAMLVAIPLAILGAIYTAYFMTPKMRSTIKPTIEIMEALPTVILGFLAGLWLAPLVNTTCRRLQPLPAAAAGDPDHQLSLAAVAKTHPHPGPGWLDRRPADPGHHSHRLARLHPQPSAGAVGLRGDMRSWMSNEMGIDFDQRNAMIVGLAMGFAIIHADLYHH